MYTVSNITTDFILENLKFQNNVIENRWRYKVKRFLFLDSNSIYPKLTKQHIKEEYLLSGNFRRQMNHK